MIPPGCGRPICGAPIGCQARNCKLRHAATPAEAAALAHQARRQAIADAAIAAHAPGPFATITAARIELRRLITGGEEEAEAARHAAALPVTPPAASPVTAPAAVTPSAPPRAPAPAAPQGSLFG